ncbi:phosphoenolpyruvate synthase [candidate division KSB1 bacterium]|nr:phosphoenolpyruvate synthase [candidate division KSB1 bacterium]
MKRRLWIFLLWLSPCRAQPLSDAQLSDLVLSFKNDERGPYQAIRWFCPDGSVLPPDQRCPQPGGIQHGLLKDIVSTIALEKKIYFGQILAGTSFPDFWDAENQNARAKQYQLERYLQLADDGWIFRKACYYRGAVQAEDEEKWGQNFLQWLSADRAVLEQQFFLIRQLSIDIPHRTNDTRLGTIRALAKAVSDSLPAFNNIRVKIHGQPDGSDAERVKDFYLSGARQLSARMKERLVQLENLIRDTYAAPHPALFEKYLDRIPQNLQTHKRLSEVIGEGVIPLTSGSPDTLIKANCKAIVSLLWTIRMDVTSDIRPGTRSALLDLSTEMETFLYKQAALWQPESIRDLLDKNYSFLHAMAGCGYIEVWEWQAAEKLLYPQSDDKISLTEFMDIFQTSRRCVEWGASTISAVYQPVVSLFNPFEPKAAGFIDEKIRASILLRAGQCIDVLAAVIANYEISANNVLNLNRQNRIRGLNPGFTLAELNVITGSAENVDFQPDKIYAMSQPPVNLKPVSGILTVSAGNLVSHVQLLARNLGIPNAIISRENLQELAKWSGQNVFYAVSPGGTVVLKPADDMDNSEKQLVEKAKHRDNRIAVPLDKLRLDDTELRPLAQLRAAHSGRICGPKAANLGELGYLFPENVVSGFIIPFGVFRQHMNQEMPGEGISYWDFLLQTFSQPGDNNPSSDQFILERLAVLRDAIKKIPFERDFEWNLRWTFRSVFDKEMGNIPVFIRSDTNMEDLKDFTGAGLNLTVFNVRESQKILQGIKDVWASPFSERSYGWRQKFLLNPENVFPSILIIPTVNVEKSGVLITMGSGAVAGSKITVAFNRGAGGAVEGQIAETRFLFDNGIDRLVFPSRSILFSVLPETGGTRKQDTWFFEPILTGADLKKLREMAGRIDEKFKMTLKGPLDVELGFLGGDIFLFQVRPYVQNKNARSNTYLQSLDKPVPDKIISLNKKIKIISTTR